MRSWNISAFAIMAQAIRLAAAGSGHAKQPFYFLRDSGAQSAHIVQNGDGAIDALLQNIRGVVDIAFGHGHKPYQVGKVGHPAAYPTRCGKARIVFFIEYDVFQARRSNCAL